MEGQRKAGERGFNLASLNLDAEPAPKKEPQKKVIIRSLPACCKKLLQERQYLKLKKAQN